jgi:putative MATE family efflux protein
VKPVDREIWRLAVPAFLALIAEPLYLLADAAIIGHVGTPELAGLGVAGVVLQTAIGLCVFLAYGTTASVARHLGAGDLRSALAQGIDGVWLAVLIGGLTTVAGILTTPWLIGAFDVSDEVAHHGETYLRVAFLGTVPLLVMLATTGVLRGLQDTRTPLVVAVAGNAANVVLNLVLVFGLGPVPALGVAGAALGSVIAQTASALALVTVVVRAAREHGSPLTPDRAGITAAARASVGLVIRTLALRASLLVGTYAVTLAGSDSGVELATHQIAITVWSFLAFALDAIAIAAQALTGRTLGEGDPRRTRELTTRMLWWGLGSGVVSGVALAAVSPWLGALFTTDQAVRDLLVPVLFVAALGQPLAGVVFVLDGVLIGAGDGTWLAWAGVGVLAVYAPVVMLAAAHGLVVIWLAMTVVFMGARGIALVHRARGERWLVTGSGVRNH